MARAPTFLDSRRPWMVVGADLRLLLDREAEIVATPRYFHACAGSIGAFTAPDTPLGIGHLLCMWKIEGWIRPCTRCGAPARIFFAGFLLGEARWCACCAECDSLSMGSEEGPPLPPPGVIFCGGDFDTVGAGMWADAIHVLSNHRNVAKVIRGCQPRFSWSKGLAGFSSEDLVVEPRVEPLPMAALLDVLRGGTGTVAIRDANGAAKFAFDWSTETLRDLEGRPLFSRATSQRDDTRIVDARGETAFHWDGRFLSGPRHEYLYETRGEDQFKPIRDGEPMPCLVSLDEPGGRTVAKLHRRLLCRPDGEIVLTADFEVPLVMLVSAWRSA